MTSVIAASVLFAAIGAAYLLQEYKFKGSVVGDLLKDFVDISPAVILLPFCGQKTALFLMACLIANEFIYDNLFAGAGIFAVGYVSASLLAVWGSSDFIKMDIAFVISAAIVATLLSIWNGDLKMKIWAGAYGELTLPLLLYAFSTTWNPGFLALAVGDALLLASEICKGNKAVRAVADLFYFFGTCFVPLSLVGRWL